MILQLLSPGIEDTSEPRQIGAEETVVFGKASHGFGGGGKEGFIADLLMGTNKGTQSFRYREDVGG